jgi:hypothetical protein
MEPRRRPITVVTAAAIAALLAGCGTTATHPASSARPHRSATSQASATHSATVSTVTTPATASARQRRLHRTLLRIRRVGRLPQTMTLPSPRARVFHVEMRALWTAVRTDRPARGLPAFFPATAYAQVKTIYDPRADWQARLVGDFDLDVRAAHVLLGSRPATARLVRVSVPMADAHWIPPGVCDNRVGYYEVPNARMVYRVGRSIRSFGIASMISWRELWFVVHLGAILRQTSSGQVDDPSVGPGVSVPSSTC